MKEKLFSDPQHEINRKFYKLEKLQYGENRKWNDIDFDKYLYGDFEEYEREDLMSCLEYISDDKE